MLIRKNYLNQLISGKNLKLIKVITGVRRSGKSTLLLQFKDYLISQNISTDNIIYMNFESADWYDIKDYKDLYNYIKKTIRIIFYLMKFKMLKNGRKQLILC